MQSVLAPFEDKELNTEKDHRKALSTALKLVWPVRGGALEMTPEQMHLFLDSLKTNDQMLYKAFAARVEKIDPLFFK
jgi:hypothetical protein